MDKELFNIYKNALEGCSQIEPLCNEYRNRWRACNDNKEKLVELSLCQQAIPWFVTMCYLRRGVGKEYLLREYNEYINGFAFKDCDGVRGYTYGLYVDWDYENDLTVDKDVVSVMWTIGANLIVPKTKATTIYISNKSNVHIVGDGYNNINVKLFDKSKITIEDLDEESEVAVYKYSDDAQVELGKYCLGKVKVFRKELRL